MGKLYGNRPTPANVNVPSGRPSSGQFPGIPAPIDFGKDALGTQQLPNPAEQPGGEFPSKPFSGDIGVP